MPQRFDRWRNQGSAGVLAGSAGLTVVFVNDPLADPWAAEDRGVVARHVLDATDWIEAQAAAHGVALRFLVRFTRPVTVDNPIDAQDGAAGPHHSTWQNTAVTRLFGTSLSVSDAESRLRADITPGDLASFAVLFVVRRAGVPSRAFPFQSGRLDHHEEFGTERAIVYDDGSRHLASLVAHELLHLYGAMDLERERFELARVEPQHVADAIIARCTEHEPDLMHTPTQKPIDQYVASELTAYLVGWRDTPPAWLLAAGHGRERMHSAPQIDMF